MSITSVPSITAQQEQHSDDEIDALFEDEEDSFAEAAAQTVVMQEEIEIKPPSRIALAARKVWDRMLIFYLWMQERYARMRVYLRTRFNRPDQQKNPSATVSPKAENIL